MNTDDNRSLRALGIELKAESFDAVCVNGMGEVGDSMSGTIEAGGEIVAQINDFLSTAATKLGAFETIGLAVPGLVDVNTNMVVYSAQFPDLEHTDIAAGISGSTGKPTYLENDANAAAFGELKAGAGRDTEDLFYVTAGTGVGGALIFDGKLWHGVSGFAGEFGYFAIDAEGRRLEDVASASGVVRRAKNRLHQDPASSLFEIGEEKITFEDVLSAANEEDGLAELILERTGMFLGTAVASVINLLNIEKIIIGGELMKASNVVLGPIRKRAEELSFEPGFRKVEIKAGFLNGNAGSIGAALIALRKHG